MIRESRSRGKTACCIRQPQVAIPSDRRRPALSGAVGVSGSIFGPRSGRVPAGRLQARVAPDAARCAPQLPVRRQFGGDPLSAPAARHVFPHVANRRVRRQRDQFWRMAAACFLQLRCAAVTGDVRAARSGATLQAGLWWDPDQIGTGYTITINHGVLVVAVYSYAPDGSPQWYLASGPLSTDGQVLSATLNKYVGGPCITAPISAPRGPSATTAAS